MELVLRYSVTQLNPIDKWLGEAKMLLTIFQCLTLLVLTWIRITLLKRISLSKLKNLLAVSVLVKSINCRTSLPELIYKKDCLKNDTKLTGKQLCRHLLRNICERLHMPFVSLSAYIWFLLKF